LRHLAVYLVSTGNSVALVDLDPQQSTGVWYKRRTDPGISFLDDKDNPYGGSNLNHEKFARDILSLKRGGAFDYIFIDTPGKQGSVEDLAMGVADYVVIPTSTHLDNLLPVKLTTDRAKDLGKQAGMIITQSRIRMGTRLSTAIRALEVSTSLPVCSVPMTMQMAYADTFALGQGITEAFPNHKGSYEIRNIWNWIEKQLNEVS